MQLKRTRPATVLRPVLSVSVLLATLGLFLSGAIAAGLDEGLAANQRGDHAAALKLLRPLADDGEPRAQVIVGKLLILGTAGRQDANAGRRYLERAAAASHTRAMATLGWLLVTAQGLPYEPDTAVGLLSRAARTGDPEAQYMLGFARLRIVRGGGAADRREAIAWLKKAARQHYSPAFLTLANYHEGEVTRRLNGTTPADPDATYAEALKWAMIALYTKAPGAESIYFNIAARVRDDETLRSIAASRARDWLRKHPKPER